MIGFNVENQLNNSILNIDREAKRNNNDGINGGINDGINGGINSGINGRISIILNTTHKKIMESMLKKNTITMVDIASEIGVSVNIVEKNIKFLKSAGLIKREGARKNGYWVVVN